MRLREAWRVRASVRTPDRVDEDDQDGQERKHTANADHASIIDHPELHIWLVCPLGAQVRAASVLDAGPPKGRPPQ